MAAVLVGVLVLAVMWAAAIVIDRYASNHWYTVMAHCELEEQE
jgi:hypothetical protein